MDAAALARGFIKDKRGGDGGVQGVYRLRKLDANERVGAAFDFGRKAGAFAADEERDGLAKIKFVRVTSGGVFCRRRGDDFQPRDAKLREGDGRGDFEESRKAQGGAGGGSERFRGIRMRGALRGDNSGGAEGFGGAENCANVAGILHADENYDEGIETAQKIVEGELRRTQEGGDALGCFRAGDGGEKLVGGVEDDCGAVEFGEKRREGFFARRAGENGFEFETGADRVGNETCAFKADALVFRARRVEDGAEKFEPVIFARGDRNRRGLGRARRRFR